MSAAQIIEAIKQLPIEERIDVISFARQYQAATKLTPEELGELGKRLAITTDPAEIAALEKAMTNGFYGLKVDA